MRVSFWKNPCSERGAQKLRLVSVIQSDPWALDPFLTPAFPADRTRRVPIEGLLGLDLWSDDVLLPLEQFSDDVGIHGFQHEETVAMEVCGVHSDYH